jgi:hypothetical protein
MKNFAQPTAPPGQDYRQVDDLMVKDPNCGIYFPKREGIRLQGANVDLYFCSAKCRDEYLARQGNDK